MKRDAVLWILVALLSNISLGCAVQQGSREGKFLIIGPRRYELLRSIGVGAEGRVYEAEDLHDQSKWAVKNIYGTASTRIANEINLHQKASGIDGVIPIREAAMVKDQGYLVMERCPGDLFHLLDRGHFKNHEEDIKSIVLQIVATVKRLHAASIYHLDLKPENILVDSSMNVKIADFGFASSERYLRSFTKGTLDFVSPARINDRQVDAAFEDLWAIAITTYILCTTSNPWAMAHFRDMDYLRFLKTVKFSEERATLGSVLPEPLSALLKDILWEPVNMQSAPRMNWKPIVSLEEFGARIQKMDHFTARQQYRKDYSEPRTHAPSNSGAACQSPCVSPPSSPLGTDSMADGCVSQIFKRCWGSSRKKTQKRSTHVAEIAFRPVKPSVLHTLPMSI